MKKLREETYKTYPFYIFNGLKNYVFLRKYLIVISRKLRISLQKKLLLFENFDFTIMHHHIGDFFLKIPDINLLDFVNVISLQKNVLLFENLSIS